MGSRKKNASQSSTVKQTDGKPKSNHSVEKSKNGTRNSKSRSAPQPVNRGSGMRWVVIVFFSAALAGIAIIYTNPEVQNALGQIIERYFHPDILNTVYNSDAQNGKPSPPEVPLETGSEKQGKQQSDRLSDKLKSAENNRNDNVKKSESPPEDGVTGLKESSKSKGATHASSHESEEKVNMEKDEKQNPDAKPVKSKPDRGSSKTEREKGEEYGKMEITSTSDFKIRKKLDVADSLFDESAFEEALKRYDAILVKNPDSPRAIYGKALTLDRLAEIKRSNEILEKCIKILESILEVADVPDSLLLKAGKKLAERQQFRGWGIKALQTHRVLVERFPDDVKLKQELGVGYLMIGRNSQAKDVFKQILKTDHHNGFALVHLGFIIKTSENDPKSAIHYLKEGLATNAPGTNDGRFYFHLGDALQRIGKTEEAYKYYEEGASKGLFLSKYQRSLYNINSLTGRPWWTQKQTGYVKYFKMLEEHWKTIREEGMAQLDSKTGLFVPEEENLREKGDWKQLTLFVQGRKIFKNCEKAPETCSLIDKMPDAKNCKRGQVKFSVMHPGVHVWPHCGPTNCRIRAHLGLKVPPGPQIRVVNETREWKEGKIIIFDDSFEHEVWHNGMESRLVLIVDFWHPELTAEQKKRLSPI